MAEAKPKDTPILFVFMPTKATEPSTRAKELLGFLPHALSSRTKGEAWVSIAPHPTCLPGELLRC